MMISDSVRVARSELDEAIRRYVDAILHKGPAQASQELNDVRRFTNRLIEEADRSAREELKYLTAIDEPYEAAGE